MFFLAVQYLGLLIYFFQDFYDQKYCFDVKENSTSSQGENLLFDHKSVRRLHFGGIFLGENIVKQCARAHI